VRKHIQGEKLGIFIEFEKGDPSDLRPQDDKEGERIVAIHELPAHILR
jgi:hypothetical protein